MQAEKGATMQIINWRPYERNTLLGFLEVELPSGLRIKDMTLHRKDGRKWIGYPARPYKAEDGTEKYNNIIYFADKDIHGKFQKQVLAAVDAYLSKNQRAEKTEMEF